MGNVSKGEDACTPGNSCPQCLSLTCGTSHRAERLLPLGLCWIQHFCVTVHVNATATELQDCICIKESVMKFPICVLSENKKSLAVCVV